MKRFGVAAALILGTALTASAQTVRRDVTGVVVDSTGTTLPSATVVALTRADSVLAKFAASGGDGTFTLRRLERDDYILQVTFVGFQPFWRDFSVGDSDVDIGTIRLDADVAELGELVVSADHVPFVVRRDTLEYNAAAFGTRPNAVVEDLLRRLPGIEVEDDGSITAQGEEVQNVLVDGKEFFGSDPTITTKNLPAEAVDRVKVYDKQSDQAEFTGIPDGQEEKTIDLELKEDAKRGYFGRLAGGFGGENAQENVYDGEASINRFSPSVQTALIANANNLNRPGFAWGDFVNFMAGGHDWGGDGRRGAGPQIGGDLNDGYSESLGLGLNAGQDFGKKTWVRVSWFFHGLDNVQDRVVQQRQLLGSDLSSLVERTTDQASDNLTHRVNLNTQAALSEGHVVRLRGNLTAVTSSLSSLGFQQTRDATQLTKNTAQTRYGTSGSKLGGNLRLTWRTKLTDAGTSLVAHARVDLDDSDLTADLASTAGVYEEGDAVTYDGILQEQSKLGNTLSQTQRLSLTHPLGERRSFELFGERAVTAEEQSKSFYDTIRGVRVFNDRLSSGFERTYRYLRGGFRLSHRTDRSWLVVGVGVQGSDLAGTVPDRGEEISNGYLHLLPGAVFKMQVQDSRSFEITYRTSTREPTMTELQPFTDNSDPLSVYTGNPDLTPEYRHNLSAHHRYYDQFTFVHLFARFGVAYTKHRIVPSRQVDEQLRQSVTSVNSDAGWSSTAAVHFGTPLRPLGVRLNASDRITYSAGSEFVNGAENRSRIWRNTIEASVNNRAKDMLDARAGGRVTYNRVEYSLNENLNRTYVNTSWFADVSYHPGYLWTLSGSVDYRAFDQDVFGEVRSVALVGASVSRLVMHERAEVMLAVRDLLNRNEGVNFTNSSTWIQEERIESLGRYVLVKFVYRLSGLASGRKL